MIASDKDVLASLENLASMLRRKKAALEQTLQVSRSEIARLEAELKIGMTTTLTCRHHWKIETPDGPTSIGTCQVCAETREFINYTEYVSWGDTTEHQKNVSHDVAEGRRKYQAESAGGPPGGVVVEPYFDNGIVQLYQADAREIPLSDQSVHCVVTSPPYFGLRVYSDNDERGIGLETSVEVYVANLVEVFREVRRVLRDDGVCWINLGDSMSGSWGNYNPGQNGHGGEGQRSKETERFSRPAYDGVTKHRPAASYQAQGNRLGIPERVVMALQADGWIWRDTVIWAKKSAMPESVNGWRWERCKEKTGRETTDWSKVPKGWDTGEGSHDVIPQGNYSKVGKNETHIDRRKVGFNERYDQAEDEASGKATTATFEDCPGCSKCEANDGLVLRRGSWRTTSSHEYIYMLTKGMGYFCDAEAVKTASIGSMNSFNTSTYHVPNREELIRPPLDTKYRPSMVNRRSVWSDISPEPYGGVHFATFPSDLPRICIQASTSEKGVCPECGMQWARVVEKTPPVTRTVDSTYAKDANRNSHGVLSDKRCEVPGESKTVGWRATCDCNADVIPATVLDPFAGTFTTGVAAQKLGRRAVGTDISESYLKQAVKRLTGVPLPLL